MWLIYFSNLETDETIPFVMDDANVTYMCYSDTQCHWQQEMGGNEALAGLSSLWLVGCVRIAMNAVKYKL